MSIVKKTGKLIIVFFLVLIIISLLTNVVGLLRQRMIIGHEEQVLEKLKKENQQLSARLDYAESDEFIEEEARNNLGLSKGETIAILPERISESKSLVGKDNEDASCWRQWWRLLWQGSDSNRRPGGYDSPALTN